MCRHNPYKEEDEHVENNDDAPTVRIETAFSTALRAGMSNRTDKRTQKLKTTLRKWEKKLCDARKDYNKKQNDLNMLKKNFDARIRRLQKQKEKAFATKNKKKIGAVNTSRKMHSMARAQVFNAKLRIAKKHGFCPR